MHPLRHLPSLLPLGQYLATCALALAAALAAPVARAGVGLAQLPGEQEDGPVTVFYPTDAADRPVQRGPFTLQAAAEAAPARGNGRLIVLSHGSGGAPWPQSDLARRLVEAGFVVALPEHRGDNWKDQSEIGPASWKRRPAEVSRAIDAVARDARFAPLLQLDRVGMWGMSAGGHTALTLAGGRWSPAQLLRHCEAHLAEDFATCAGPSVRLQGDWLDGAKKSVVLAVARRRLDDAQWYAHEDPRIQAVVAEVPFSVDFDLASLARPRTALGIVQAQQDRWLTPRFHSAALLKACATCETVADQPDAGHGSLLSPQPGGLSGTLAWLMADPPGYDRAQVPAMHLRIAAFFQRHLLLPARSQAPA